MLVTLQALTPVIGAVAEFPFGLSETKLIQDISDKLEKDAVEIVSDSASSGKLSELLVFKSLAKIYAECHLAETNRLLGSGDDGRSELSIEPVWENYETRLAMVRALMGEDETMEQSGASDIVPDVSAPPPEQPVISELQAVEAPLPVPPPPSATTSAPPSGGPMGFFTKKEDAAPAQPVAESLPAAPPPPAEPQAQQPAQSAPPSPPPASSSTGGPMGFFAKKDNTDNSSS
jgi:hypothetical protein